eukprot:ANDGO_07993.mRNA.1 Multiprotein-bridging factor 1b
MADADWNTVVINRSRPNERTKATAAEAARAKQRGADVETMKKMTTGNKNHVAPSSAARIEAQDEEGDFHHKSLSLSVRQRIQQARLAKKWTQAELAKAINEKATVINDYEAGKAIPNPQVLNKLEKVLGQRLRD